MRQITLLTFVLAGALAAATACSDAPTTSEPSTLLTGAPAGSSPALPQANGTLGFAAREIPVGARLLLQGPLVSSDRYTAISSPLTWRTTDPTIVALAPTQSVAWVTGVRPGIGVVSVTGGALASNVPITVLGLTSAPGPVVVEDFYVIEFGGEGGWGYAPQFVLRDSSGKGGSAVIGLSMDLPDAGGPSPRCAMLRPVGTQPTELFHEEYGDFELSYNGSATYRVPAGKPVVAHLTLRVPGPFAKELTLEGRVVPGTWPTTYSGRVVEDVLSCG